MPYNSSGRAHLATSWLHFMYLHVVGSHCLHDQALLPYMTSEVLYARLRKPASDARYAPEAFSEGGLLSHMATVHT